MTRDKLAAAVALTLFATLYSIAGFGRPGVVAHARAAEPNRPNVVVIQTDDQSYATLRATFRDFDDNRARVMPNTLSLVAAKGVEFTNYYVSHPVCSPSRATLLSGQYAHTNGLRKNSGPDGGWQGWRNLPIMNENLPVALQRAGYRTSYIGKFTNGYHGATSDIVETLVPPGWDHWYVSSYGGTLFYYGARLNINGVVTGPFGDIGYDMNGVGTDPPECQPENLLTPVPGVECNHSTDLYSRSAVEQIQSAGDQPFYIQIGYNTPHGDHRPPIGAQPLSRHYDTALKTKMPRPVGFNEADISDKPSFIKSIPVMARSEIQSIETRWQKDLESLRGVDDGVGAIVKALRQTGKLANTYILFTSDNGMFRGEHRMSSAKFLPHEPSARVPMLIRGPGIKPRSKSAELVANVDIAPTILSLTGAKLSRGFDGRSMRPYWKNPKRKTRRPIVLESFIGPQDAPPPEAGIAAAAPPRNFSGLRVGRYKYIEYTNGERELYDLVTDPDELNNRIHLSAWRNVARRLSRELAAKRNCRGSACRATVAALPKPPAVKATARKARR